MRISIFLASLFLVLCLTSPGTAQVVYVDQNAPGPEHDGNSWDTAFAAIQDGVDAATPGGEVWVADGTYVENVVMGEGVAIYGGFLGAEPGGYETSLDQRDWVAHVATIDGKWSGSCVIMAGDAHVDGFTVTRGSGTLAGGGRYGGGLYCKDLGATGVIANNTITANGGYSHPSPDWGGGVHCDNSSPSMTRNTISHNHCIGNGGGLSCTNGSAPVVTENTIADNYASSGRGGGGIYGGGGIIAGNAIIGNESLGSGAGGGGGIHCGSGSMIVGNLISGNTDYPGIAGIYVEQGEVPEVIAGNLIVSNGSEYDGWAVYCKGAAGVSLVNNTILFNHDGIHFEYGWGTVANNIIAWNQWYGVQGNMEDVVLSHNCVWENLRNYEGVDPGETDIIADPLLLDPENGLYHLTQGSPCIDAGDNAAEGIPDIDWQGEDRIVNGVVDIGADEYVPYYTEAPDPQPECNGALFGGSQSGYPAWVWFSIPLAPDCVVGSGCADPNNVLGMPCQGRLWYLDKYLKSAVVYQPPWVEWDLGVGDSYLLFLWGPEGNPSYTGLNPYGFGPFEFRLGRMGWTWAGMPGLAELTGDGFMGSVRVRYPADDTGSYRTARQDRAATPDNWLQWGWAFWDTYNQAPRAFTPYLPFGCNTCYPWIGYRLWVNLGSAVDEEDADQVTLIWP